ncbi:hypothetical protein HNR60_000688 [Rhodopseudomonas rhenobacensis]|uniref:Tyrosyl-DNA phosphodiesterase n=1 Tax=Rhodopseudomonas rhenobacensis TaxID=87461 RepID=A0A7W7Z0U8_9BRAD|nr:hypothetical protein [Rhodopseudomonas rhenobacensis]MBB5045953.1 hypothetical protein [Rhodopseudomonas rhenobacensis]
MDAIGWESLLRTDAPPECTLLRALFTTYDRADERLLVEHALPLFLKLGHEPGGEGAERHYFLIELDCRLRQMHDRIVVISSNTRDEPADEEVVDSAYQWIWRSIRHLTVGSRGRAVQHAKLWLLHWRSPTGTEYLEIVVSSANLTLAALRGQLQAAWRTLIELRAQSSGARRAGWGILTDFVVELASSAGDPHSLDHFVELLGRSDCPEGVSFVASVPGSHSRADLRHTPWGAAGLAKITPAGNGPTSVSIMAPYVGSWNSDALDQWCSSFGGMPKKLRLVCIGKDHPWQRHWLLPAASLSALLKSGASLIRLRRDPAAQHRSDAFHERHRKEDDRWSHAKLYHFRRGNSRRLLVTSANFSMAAWGKSDHGALTIENFELGVCIEQAEWPFEHLERFGDANDIATVANLATRSTPTITWAQAAWDGRQIKVECRCRAPSELSGELCTGTETTRFAGWARLDTTNDLYRANIPYAAEWLSPFVIGLACNDERLRIPIFDERQLAEREITLLPEVDEALMQSLRDQLLFEEYGGGIAPDDQDLDPLGGDIVDQLPIDEDDIEATGAGPSDSYAVPAFVIARRHLAVVDSWSGAVRELSKRQEEDFRRVHLRRDGELLVNALLRQAERDGTSGKTCALGAGLAAEEMQIRLQHFPEE